MSLIMESRLSQLLVYTWFAEPLKCLGKSRVKRPVLTSRQLRGPCSLSTCSWGRNANISS